MKYSFLLLILLAGCTCKYPKIVHNSCTGKWAVKTGHHTYLGIDEYNIVELSYRVSEYDTSVDMKLGKELQFDDSLSAAQCYRRVKIIPDSLKIINDSIYKCQHTYK